MKYRRFITTTYGGANFWRNSHFHVRWRTGSWVFAQGDSGLRGRESVREWMDVVFAVHRSIPSTCVHMGTRIIALLLRSDIRASTFTYTNKYAWPPKGYTFVNRPSYIYLLIECKKNISITRVTATLSTIKGGPAAWSSPRDLYNTAFPQRLPPQELPAVFYSSQETQ